MTGRNVEAGLPSRTSIWAAAARAVGAREPDPEMRNPDWLAERLLGPEELALIQEHPLSHAMDQDYAEAMQSIEVASATQTLMVRTRFIDDKLERAVRAGARQFVILGAGFDSRAYRLRALLQGVRVIEVDKPETQAHKKRRVQEAAGGIPPNLTYAAIDFRRDDLGRVLADAGYDPALRTFFIWEGVTMYLPEEAVRQTLSWVAQHAGPGSTIVFDFAHKRLIELIHTIRDEHLPTEAARVAMARVRQITKWGEPWIFGIEEGQEREFLGSVGLELRELMSMSGEEATRRYLTRSDGSPFVTILAPPRAMYCILEAGVGPI